MQSGPNGVWWGSHALPTGKTLRLEVGSVEIEIRNRPQVWRLAWDWQRDEDRPPRLEVLDEQGEESALGNQERHVFRDAETSLRVIPRTGDRAFVTAPRIPMFIHPGEEVTLFIDTPVWLRLEVGSTGRLLEELAVTQPSETWFGSPTGSGEVCYALRSHAALESDNLPRRHGRVVTPVSVRNSATEPFHFQRLKLPVEYLSVFAAGGRLWTEQISLDRTDDDELASVTIQPGAPRAAPAATHLSSPRSSPGHGSLMRVFSNLLSF